MQTKDIAGWYGIDGIVVSRPPEARTDGEHLMATFDQIARYIRELVGAHQSAVSYIPDGDFSRAVHSTSLSEKYARYRTYGVMPTGKGIWAVVCETAKPMRLTEKELKAHPRFLNFSDLKDSQGLEHPPMPGWLAVPVLEYSGKAIGVLQLSDRYEGDFTEEDQARLQQVAALVAPTMEAEYLYQQVQKQKQQLQLSIQELDAHRQAALNLAQDEMAARQRAERAEQEIRTLNAELEQRVQDRTAALQAEICQRKRSEENLRQAEGRIQAIVDHVASAIITINERGIVDSFNRV